MKKFIISIIGIAVVLFGLDFFGPGGKYEHALPNAIKNFDTSAFVSELKNLGEEVSAPPPLKSKNSSNKGVLSRAGIIQQTNLQRAANGNLPALKENDQLNAAAWAKAADIFSQQYFDHVNPQGKGPADVTREAGYEYISVGENLAMGFFEDDKDLVEAWMNSPGHRENILNGKYEEIGAAAIKGMYEGKETWVAVQEFGRPASSCPRVDVTLKASIDSLQNEIDALQDQLVAMKVELDSMNPKTPEEYEAYNKKVAEYNSQIKIFNNKVDVLKTQSARYNSQVSVYNICLNS